MKKLLTVTIVSSCLLFATANVPSALAYAADDGAKTVKTFKAKHKQRAGRMAKALGLTEEQKTAIQDIREQAKSEKSVLKEQLAGFKEDVKTLMNKEEFDETAFLNLKNEHQDTFTQLALLKAKTRHAIAQVLTDEQREKAGAFKEKRRARLFH